MPKEKKPKDPYAKTCMRCVNDCKQPNTMYVLACPRYGQIKKQSAEKA